MMRTIMNDSRHWLSSYNDADFGLLADLQAQLRAAVDLAKMVGTHSVLRFHSHNTLHCPSSLQL
jgi:hypothetical protein